MSVVVSMEPGGKEMTEVLRTVRGLLRRLRLYFFCTLYLWTSAFVFPVVFFFFSF